MVSRAKLFQTIITAAAEAQASAWKDCPSIILVPLISSTRCQGLKKGTSCVQKAN